jgi:hypothetical protein
LIKGLKESTVFFFFFFQQGFECTNKGSSFPKKKTKDGGVEKKGQEVTEENKPGEGDGKRLQSMAIGEDENGIASPNSTVSSLSGNRSAWRTWTIGRRSSSDEEAILFFFFFFFWKAKAVFAVGLDKTDAEMSLPFFWRWESI